MDEAATRKKERKAAAAGEYITEPRTYIHMYYLRPYVQTPIGTRRRRRRRRGGGVVCVSEGRVDKRGGKEAGGGCESDQQKRSKSKKRKSQPGSPCR
ncbi:hypothetical protein L249_0773 [Ophiocordyceps polyrhachis-furcata BCC 54312]|uniref:Uncharacterized protein n=1 Tax=Ophiocordyceps polyrhachis-furcata BCC 54312 TaxID=1330021 RepID=A0A367LCM6_9HYPO|nr:hypothetical protein L249_0773 [Ophiocordyceps polyrhachis-furcata BCC 54312]